MRRISVKNYFIFSAIILFAGIAFGLMIYSGARLFFVDRLVGKENAVANKECVYFGTLDGACLTKGETEKYPVAVMIDNKEESWPWSGLSYAGLVYEAPVEGGITRFLAVYTTDKEIEKIGPVRSIRPYFIDWAEELGAILAHVGGSDAALGIIQNSEKLRSLDLDEYRWGGIYFWRSRDRIAPHNTYTSSELLNKVREEKKTGELDFDSWEFKDDAFSSERGDVKNIQIKFSIYPQYDGIWEYDKEKNDYRRKILTKYAKDEDGRMILAKNIVVLATDIKIIDAISRREIATIGSGDALVFQDGKKIEARWEKKDRESRLNFFDLNGKPIQFNRGTTWVEVVDDLGKVTKN